MIPESGIERIVSGRVEAKELRAFIYTHNSRPRPHRDLGIHMGEAEASTADTKYYSFKQNDVVVTNGQKGDFSTSSMNLDYHRFIIPPVLLPLFLLTVAFYSGFQ